eukprot:scaffold18781_cov51-Phaeocystis_antarctica.AAC.1
MSLISSSLLWSSAVTIFCSASTTVAALVSSGGRPVGAAGAAGAIDTSPPTVGVDGGAGAGADMPSASIGVGPVIAAGASPLSRSLPSGATEVLPRMPNFFSSSCMASGIGW